MQAKIIKMILAYKDMKLSDLADKLNTSRPNLTQKMKRDNFSENELNEIASALECNLKITFTDKKSGKEFSS